MNLLVDLGNSFAKYAFYSHNVVSEVVTVDYETLSSHLTSDLNNKITDCDGVYVSCVSQPSALELLTSFAKQHQLPINIASTKQESNKLINGYHNKTELGVDRWLAMLAVTELYPSKNCLVIDIGTAMTIDYVSEKSEFKGGWIVPGSQTMVNSLLGKTAQIKQVAEHDQCLSFAQTTSLNVARGSRLAINGAILMAIKQCQKENLPITHIIITGGGASDIESGLDNRIVQHANLVFIGLTYFFNINKADF